MEGVQELLLPLFPLELVLFPGQRLPLHIFEERYKTMVRDCLEPGPEREFGIVLAKENAIVNVGCTAVVSEVTRRYPDGRMDIVASGKRRFEVLFLDESRDYLRAAAQFFDDEEVNTPSELRGSVLDLHRQVVQLLPGDNETVAVEADEMMLSYRLAGPLPLDLDFKQVLLALRSEPERLKRVGEYFEQLLPRLRMATWARSKAGGNGQCR